MHFSSSYRRAVIIIIALFITLYIVSRSLTMWIEGVINSCKNLFLSWE